MVGFSILLALIGTPLFIVVCCLTLYSFYTAEIDLTILLIEMYRLAEMPALSAIPLFAFSGFVLSASKAPERIVRISQALLHWLPGGLAIVSLVVCALFTALTGASGMTIIALGGLLWPALSRAGYRDDFSLGLLTTSGSLGLLLPPSLPLILYAIIAEVAIDDHFLAGLVPGALLITALSLYSVFTHRHTLRKDTTADIPPSLSSCLREGVWELVIPLVLFGGIYGGLIAISEAAVLLTGYVLLIEVGIKREVLPKDLPKIAIESMSLVGAIFIILCASMAYTSYLIDQQIPQSVLAFFQLHIESKWVFLLILNIFLLAVGCIIDMFSALVLVVPLVLPLASAFDVHPIHLGILFLTNLEIGYSTPPIGMNLFISSMRFERPILTLYKASIPFLSILLFCLLLITYIPAISLFLID
jgi:C4-dicarboxylate transporter DctM subunit